MSEESKDKKTTSKSKERAKIVGIAAAVAGLTYGLWWALHGTWAAIIRWAFASTGGKVLLVGAGTALVCGWYALMASGLRHEVRSLSYGYRLTDEERAERAEQQAQADRFEHRGIVLGIVTAVLMLLAIVAAIFGGQERGMATASKTVETSDPTVEYAYRSPWIVASATAQSRAGASIGDIAAGDTTYLPATDQYVTPVKNRETPAGYGAIIVQNADGSSESCEFKDSVPMDGGKFGMNLRRAVSWVSLSLSYNQDDVWVYCKDGKAVLVVPVTRFVGFPEGHRVPAGVVLFDGSSVEHRSSVEAGELPGPVYPMSLARSQRESLANRDGIWARVRDRAGYRTTADVDGDPNAGNVSELLLARADGSGYDYVTPLTPPRGSTSIVAVSTIAADHVTDGELNELVIHQLETPRDGNETIDSTVRAAFPDLGWAAGLRLAEVLPLSPDKWVGTITTARAVVNRVTISTDGEVCLQDMAGKQLRCKNGLADGDTSGGVDGSGSEREVEALTDEELIALQRRVAAEIERRLLEG